MVDRWGQRRARYRHGTCLTASVLWALHPARLIAAAPPSITQPSVIRESDLTFVSIQASGLKIADSIYGYGKPADFCLDLQQFVDAVEFPIKVDITHQQARGWFLDETQAFALDVAAQSVTIGKQRRPLPAGSVHVTEIGLCVSVNALTDWFPLNLDYNARTGAIGLVSRTLLPVEQRRAREERHEHLVKASDQAAHPHIDLQKIPYSWFNEPTVDVTLASTVTRASGRATTVQLRYNALAVGEAAKFTSETLLRSDDQGQPQNIRLRLYRRDPQGGVFGVPALTDVTLGDVSSGGNQLVSSGSAGRGISLSTFPTSAPDEYDRTTIRGDVPIGWEAELYRNGSLIAFQPASDSGRYEFSNVPVIFGENIFKVILYGPQGQRREVIQTLNTGQIAVPKGEVYARVAVLQDRKDLIDIFGHGPGNPLVTSTPVRVTAEARAGVTDNLGVGASVQSVTLGQQKYWYGSGLLQSSIGLTGIDLEAIASSGGGYAAQLSASRRFGSTGIRARYAYFGNGFQSERVDPKAQSRLDVFVDSNLFRTSVSNVPLTLRAVWNQNRDGTSDLAATEQTSYGFKNLFLAQSLFLSKSFGASKTSTDIAGSVLASTLLGAYSLRSEIAYALAPKPLLNGIQFTLDRNTDRGDQAWHYGGSGGWSFGDRTGNFGFSATRNFSFTRLGLSATAQTNGHVSLGLNLSFSLSRDPIDHRWRIAAKDLAQTGTVITRVFDDLNGDGKYDAGDLPIIGAHVSAEGATTIATTAAGGRVVIQGLDTSRPAPLVVDSASLSNTDLVQREGGRVIVPRAGASGIVDVPLVVLGSIDGDILLQSESGERPLGGMTILLTDAQGKIVARAKSEFDGFFILQKLPLGSYRISLDADQLATLGLTATGARDITLTRHNPFPSGFKFHLQTLASAAATPSPGATKPHILLASLAISEQIFPTIERRPHKRALHVRRLRYTLPPPPAKARSAAVGPSSARLGQVIGFAAR